MAPSSLASKVLLLACVLAGASCYNPSITTGGFKCSSVWEKECPDGYKCVNNLCWKGGVVPADAGLPETKPEAPIDTMMSVDKQPEAAVEKAPDAPCTIKPVSGCTPAAGKCDPLCQTGCDGCHQKCSVNTLGALTCNEPAGAGSLQEGDSCEPISVGSDVQTDECAPGLVCVDSSCKRECLKLCRTNADCPGSTCTRDYAPGFRVCDVKAADCNPVTMNGATKCPGLAQGCFISATVADRTVCDCPVKAGGVNVPCKLSRDCVRGLVCVDATGTTDFRCQVACTLIGSMSGCSGNQMCRPLPIPGNTKWGFCRD